MVGLLGAGCGGNTVVKSEFQPTSEKEYARRKLQAPLDQRLCKAAIYASAGSDFRAERVRSVLGRGKDFTSALEALCREADGLKLPAVVDIYFARAPGGWSPVIEVRGTAVKYEEGFQPPPPLPIEQIRSPDAVTNGDEEPMPAGEAVAKPAPPAPPPPPGKRGK